TARGLGPFRFSAGGALRTRRRRDALGLPVPGGAPVAGPRSAARPGPAPRRPPARHRGIGAVKPSRPSARLTLDGRAYGAAEAGLLWLRARLGLGAAHAAVSLAAWPGAPFAAAVAGARLSVALGEAEAEEDVWSGEVTE